MKKESFKKATTAIAGFCIGTMVMPLLLAVEHQAASNFYGEPLRDYSLKNRFKTAYCINTDEATKDYHVSALTDYVHQEYSVEQCTYPVRPGATYPLTAAFGLIGAATALALKKERDEAKKKQALANRYGPKPR